MPAIVRLMLVCLLVFGGVMQADAYLGEDPGLNLYRLIDQNSGQLESRLMQKYLRGSGPKANQLIGQVCSGEWNAKINCFSGKDFSQNDLTEILDGEGGIAKLRQYTNPAITNLSTDTAEGILSNLRKYRDQLAKDASEERQGMEKFGSIGLFTDGSIENSGYDLLYDLNQINKIIFKQAPEYEGVVNANGPKLESLLAGVYDDDDDDSEYVEEGIPPTLISEEKSGGFSADITNTPATTTNVPSTLCPPTGSYPSDFLTVDFKPISNVIADSSDEVPVAPTVKTPTRSFVHDTKGSPLSGFGRTRDSFGCPASQIICIEVEFTTYKSSFGFGWGGGGNSIEDILDKNLKILDKYAVSSFAQARMTNNFFELSLKDIDLPSMAHIGTVITKKPIPILNLGKDGEQTDASDKENDEKEFKEIFARTFEAYGLDYKRQNDLTTPCVDYELTLLRQKWTEATNSKVQRTSCRPDGTQEEAYPAIKAQEMQDQYYEGFSKDINELGRFVETISGGVRSSIGVINGLNAIPKTR